MEFVATVAATAVSEGDFRADLDTEQLAFTLQGLMLGYHHAARLMRDPKALDPHPAGPRPAARRQRRLETSLIHRRRPQRHVISQ